MALWRARHSPNAAATLDGTEKIDALQSGAPVNLTPAQIAAYINTLVVGNVGARVLWALIGANMNSTADQAFTKVGTFGTYQLISNPTFVNSSGNPTTCAGGIYSAAAKGGDALVASTQVYTGANGARTGVSMVRTALGLGLRPDSALYLSLTTPQGLALTGDIYVYGIPIS